MAKKAQKGKPAKKAAKPAKKAVAKKPAKKAAPKKAAKPAKKAVAKKSVKKVAAKKPAPKKAVKPAKKAAAKKPVKKVVAKKVAPKKAAKPAKKVAPKKVAKAVKKVAPKKAAPAKKVAVKAPAKPVAKVVSKPVAKVEVKKAAPAKPEVVAKPVAPVVKKSEPVAKKKQRDYDSDEDYSSDEAPMVVEYKTPSIRRPMGPAPKPHINTDTRTRYSDSELKEFKELILKKLAEAQKDFELLKSTLSHKDDHGTDDTSPTFKLLEDGSDVLSKEETAHLASRQEKFIQNLQNALIRIENKTYGICRATGKLISKERLKSVPHATLAIEAKLEQNN
ncbi:MAG: TraR/DksA family transcriptional regulator [Bacteroidia bacterium]